MRIYWIRAQAPRRVLALVKHLGVDAELVEVDLMRCGLKTPDYVALNPNRKAPTLVDGDLVLWESAAIMAHLCIKQGSDMWPRRDPLEQIEDRAYPIGLDGERLARVEDAVAGIPQHRALIDGLMRIPAWADPWPDAAAAA
jgi:Glutathione S-transferase, N-terminal domain